MNAVKLKVGTRVVAHPDQYWTRTARASMEGKLATVTEVKKNYGIDLRPTDIRGPTKYLIEFDEPVKTTEAEFRTPCQSWWFGAEELEVAGG